jgi:hypothetical protein
MRAMFASTRLQLLALLTACALSPAVVGSTERNAPPTDPRIEELWVEPRDLATRDLYNGPWGAAHAPDPAAEYRFIAPKKGGINPGMTVHDPMGREWRVKQPPNTGRNAEGPIEVVLSRVLSAVGYHQPPVYFLPAFTVNDGKAVYRAPGGRFRLTLPGLKDVGEWKWLENPFVGTTPHYGLLVIMLMFNSSDLKDSNNTLYEYQHPDGSLRERWFVVRDIGTALGSTGRFAPVRGDPTVFERLGFIKRIENGFVEFHYNGRHQSLVDHRIEPAHVRWAAQLLSGLTPAQWHDAFRAGGYPPEVRERFINKLQSKIRDGLALQ